MSWNGSFASIASDGERQAWRDNFNGGWAAGDLTGNTNAAIAASRPGQVANSSSNGYGRMPVAVYYSGGKATVEVVTQKGPGVRSVQTAPVVPTAGPGAAWVAAPNAKPIGPGAAVEVAALPALTPVINPEITSVMINGSAVQPNPGVSDAQEFTQRYGESELLETAVGLGIVAADIQHSAPGFAPGWGGLLPADTTPNPIHHSEYAGKGPAVLANAWNSVINSDFAAAIAGGVRTGLSTSYGRNLNADGGGW